MSFLPMGSVPKALGFLLAGLARSFDSSCYSHLIANYRSTPGRLGIVSTGGRRRQPAEIPPRRRMVGHRDDRYVEILQLGNAFSRSATSADLRLRLLLKGWPTLSKEIPQQIMRLVG